MMAGAAMRAIPWIILGSASIFWAASAPGLAESENAGVARSADPLNRSSPQSCVGGFLQAAHAHDYVKASSYLDLRNLPRDARLKQGAGLAEQLGQILDRDTDFDVAGLSSDPKGAAGQPTSHDRVDSFASGGQNVDIDVERVQLRSGIWIWLFSQDTVARIPRLLRVTSESTVERHLPDPLVIWQLAGTPLWRWTALVLLAAATGILARFLCPFILRYVEPVLQRAVPHLNRGALDSFLNPFRLFLIVAVFQVGIEWVGPAPQLRLYLERALAVLLYLGVFWLLMSVVDLSLVRLRATLQSRHHTFSYSALPLAGRVLKIVILLLLVATVLTQWGYNTTTILAGLGVGGIAIALAAQKTVENFFGGVSVIADRPVTVGDFCKFGDRSGTVEDVGLRSTRIRTPDRTLVSVPNGQFSSMTIENFSRRDKMLFHFMLNLRRDTKPGQVRVLLESIGKLLSQQEKIEAGVLPVRFAGVGTYSLDLEVSVYVLTSDDTEFAAIRQELLLAILDAVEAAGTALALPTQASIDYSRSAGQPPNGAASPQPSPQPSRQ